MIDISHWYYPQILVLLWFAWRFCCQVYRCTRKETRAEIHAQVMEKDAPGYRYMDDKTAHALQTFAAVAAVLTIYGPCLLLLYLGGFFA